MAQEYRARILKGCGGRSFGLAAVSVAGLVVAACGNGSGGDSDDNSGGSNGSGATSSSSGDGDSEFVIGTGGGGEVVKDPVDPVPPEGFLNPAGTVETSHVADMPANTLIAKEPLFGMKWTQGAAGPQLPEKFYFAGCGQDSQTLFASTTLTVEESCTHSMGEEIEECGGVLVQTNYSEGEGLQAATHVQHFPECMMMHGVAASPDCSTVAVLCRRDTHSTEDDAGEITKNSLLTHADADWMTHPTPAHGDNSMDELWLYEWPDGDISQVPEKYVVHRALATKYGITQLIWGDDGTYGIAVRSAVYDDNETYTRRHDADAFLMLERETHDFTDRGWEWACGMGHTGKNFAAYNPATQKYAMHCSTDFNEDKEPRSGDSYFRVEDQDKTVNDPSGQGLKNGYLRYFSWGDRGPVGGPGMVEPVSDGGWIAALLAVPGQDSDRDDEYHDIPEQDAVGIVRFDEVGKLQGDIVWLATDTEGVVGNPQLASLGDDRYLFGWCTMQRFESVIEENAFKAPHQCHLVEIDDSGRVISEQLDLDANAAWGAWNQMKPLGRGRVGWTYIDPATIPTDEEVNLGNYWDRTKMYGHVYVSSVR